jgi:hypothetical protein
LPDENTTVRLDGNSSRLLIATDAAMGKEPPEFQQSTGYPHRGSTRRRFSHGRCPVGARLDRSFPRRIRRKRRPAHNARRVWSTCRENDSFDIQVSLKKSLFNGKFTALPVFVSNVRDAQ